MSTNPKPKPPFKLHFDAKRVEQLRETRKQAVLQKVNNNYCAFPNALILDEKPYRPIFSYSTIYSGMLYGKIPVCVFISQDEAEFHDIREWNELSKSDGYNHKYFLKIYESGNISIQVEEQQRQASFYLITEHFLDDEIESSLGCYAGTDSALHSSITDIMKAISKGIDGPTLYKDTYVMSNKDGKLKVKCGRERLMKRRSTGGTTLQGDKATYLDLLSKLKVRNTRHWPLILLKFALTSSGTEASAKKLVSCNPSLQTKAWIKAFLKFNVDEVKIQSKFSHMNRELFKLLKKEFEDFNGNSFSISTYWRLKDKVWQFDPNLFLWEDMVADLDGPLKGKFWEEHEPTKQECPQGEGKWTKFLRKTIYGEFNLQEDGRQGNTWLYGRAFTFLNFIRNVYTHQHQHGIEFTDEQIAEMIEKIFPHLMFFFYHQLLVDECMVFPF